MHTGVFSLLGKYYFLRYGIRVSILLGGAFLPDSHSEVVAFILDISDRKRAELVRDRLLAQERNARLEAEKALQVREDFISIAAHELRTPLTPLLIQADLLRKVIEGHPEVSQSKPLQTLMRVSEQQVKRLIQLVESLLDVTRIRTGRLNLNCEKINLSVIVLEVIERYQEALKKAKCDIEVDVKDKIIGRWDRVRLEQVFINVLTNAIKYGAGRPIKISLLASGQMAKLVVQDHGIGINEKDQTRIFNRFERGESINNYGGFGLGLYITSKIVEGHHGKILVDSHLGEGSTFTIILPINDFYPKAYFLEA